MSVLSNITVQLSSPVATPLGVGLVAGTLPIFYLPIPPTGNTLFFPSVTIPTGTNSTLRIQGARIAHPLSTPLVAVEPYAVKAFVSASGVPLRNPEITVGCVFPGLQFQLLTASGTATDTLLLSPSASSLTHTLVFRESLVNSFRLQASEPGSTQSTRLVAQFSNLPPGTTLSVSASSLSGPSARLTATDSGAFNPSPLTPGYVPLTIVNNAAIAVWEVQTADPTALESVTFGLIASGSSTAAAVSGRYGPADTTSLPRFLATTIPPTAGCNPTCVSVPRALSYTHRFGDPRPAAVSFPVTFTGPPTALTTEFLAADSPTWFSVSNGVAQWAPELLPPGQYRGILSVQPGNQFVHLALTVLPPLNQLAAPPLCTLSTGVAPLVRVEGLAEKAASPLLNCTGTPGATVSNATLALRFNAPVKSAAVSSANPAPLETFAIVSDPSAFPSVTLAERSGFLDGTNGLRFPGLTFAFPSSGQVTIQIVNVRLDATSLGLETGLTPSTASVRAYFTSASPAVMQPMQAVAYTSASHIFTKLPAVVAIIADPGLSLPVTLASQLSFREGFSSAFLKRNEGTTFDSPGTLIDQPFPDNNYFTESMIYAAARGPHGLATQGTRLRVVFSGVPAGTTLYVTNTKLASSTGAVQAKRIAVPATGVGPFAETPSTVTMLDGSTPYPASVVPVQNGVGVAVWEILASSIFSIDDIRFGVAAKGATSGSIAQITSSLSLRLMTERASPALPNSLPAPRPRAAKSIASVPCPAFSFAKRSPEPPSSPPRRPSPPTEPSFPSASPPIEIGSSSAIPTATPRPP